MSVEKRRHLRHTVNEPCRAVTEQGEYLGAVVNMSVSGAVVYFDVALDPGPKLEPDTIVNLRIQSIGLIRTRVVRPLLGGLAVEFLFDREKDRALVATVWEVLNEFKPTADRLDKILESYLP